MPLQQLMGLFWFLAVSLVVYLFHRQRQAERHRIYDLIHRERLKSIEKGVPYPELPPYLIEKEAREEARVRKPFQPSQLIGVACILMLGGGAAMWALRNSGEAYHRDLWTFPVIPVFLGIGLILYALINRPPRSE